MMMRWLAIGVLAVVVSFVFANSTAFLGFAINADTLYPALLMADLRADADAIFRFRPSRIPSFLPDLAVTLSLDALLGDWRLAFWGYGAVAFLLLSGIGGWIAARVFGRDSASCGLTLALILAVVMLGGVLHYENNPAGMFDLGLPVNLHLLLMLPVFQGGAFVIGLGVVSLVWWNARRVSPLGLIALSVLCAAAVASNKIVVAHAVLPALIALADGVWRGRIARRPALLGAAAAAAGAAIGVAFADRAGREAMPFIVADSFADNASTAIAALPAQPVMLLMLLASLPLALAFLLPHRAEAALPRGADAAAFRFFVVVAALACGASLMITLALYYLPLSWRYANPIAWWPLIFAAGLLRGRLAGASVVAVTMLVAVQAWPNRTLTPALLRWQPNVSACLDAADPGFTLRAGLAGYWTARDMAAASQWRRQVEQLHQDGRAALYINDPRSFVQQRHAPPGTPPPYTFIVLRGLDPAAIAAAYGVADRVLPCGDTDIWLYPNARPPGQRLFDRLLAHSPELALPP